ncbi:hypothetical protein ACIQXD_14975 [Streptomyces uncialis]|uniref:hypothetical protein n=1 Tax=Streptomyces uncialis TaxID=1048205 RepID=UPI00380A4A69
MTLISVSVGAVLSYVVGMLNERTRWRREQAARWDVPLLEAYSEYGRAVKECVVAYQRLAAHRGLAEDPTPAEPDADALERAAQAEARRSTVAEPLRLLADPATASAVRELNEAVWHLEWLARGRMEGAAADWERAHRAYRDARRAFHDKARASLQVPGAVLGERPSWPPAWRTDAPS